MCARDLLDQLNKGLSSNKNSELYLLANEAISLPCFSDAALGQLHSRRSRLSWDSGLDTFGLYSEIAILV